MQQLLYKSIKAILYFTLAAVFCTAVFLRFRLPALVFIDSDIDGYLGPAMNFLHGAKFLPLNARGLYYPLFALLCIGPTGSLNTVAVVQHCMAIAGLVFIAYTLFKLFGKTHPVLSLLLITICVAALALCPCFIKLEHTIRPEGLILFFTGLLTLLIYRFSCRRSGYVLTALALTLVFLGFTIPKFAPGSALVIAWAFFLYLKAGDTSAQQRKKLVMVNLALLMLLFLVQRGRNHADVLSRYFVGRNFFYVNAKIIKACAGAGIYNETQTAAINDLNSRIEPSPDFSLVGFDFDSHQFGATSKMIEGKYGWDIYNSILRKSLLKRPWPFITKAVKQTLTYYFSFAINKRVPVAEVYDNNLEYQESYRLATGLGYLSNNTINQYRCYASSVIVTMRLNSPLKTYTDRFIYKPLFLVTPFIFIISLGFAIMLLLQKGWNTLFILLLIQSSTVFTVGFIHSFDINRYGHTLFPVFIIICIIGFYYFLVRAISFINNFRL
ncbi:MAG TPA: hypothetical protein VG603_09675 [Chitinophagales bacterium]|nr:hypothetical protein [Chitinophagales bacterium]